MTATLPAAFADRLTRILPADRLDGVLASFAAVKDVAFRINTLKAQPDAVLAGLRAAIWQVLPPGAAARSSTISPGCGASAKGANWLARFWM